MQHFSATISTFLDALAEKGFTPSAVDNGGGKVRTSSRESVLSESLACDEATIFFHPTASGAIPWLDIVLGNSPSETVSDFRVLPNAEENALWEPTIEAVTDKLEQA